MDITEICLECKNFFLANGRDDIHSGTFTIENGTISGADFLVDSQYFRITGSKLNDGVYENDSKSLAALRDETFTGAIWDMSVPPSFSKLCEDIGEWLSKYGGVDSAAMSPFTSESFGGYSYSKSNGGSSGDGTASSNSWQGVFADRLRKWRRLNVI
ncbi:MAG: hypothetical protein IJ740_13425 [Ruminococcus sp.]|nr:hypothetical protein [Ruminococcus sp.]